METILAVAVALAAVPPPGTAPAPAGTGEPEHRGVGLLVGGGVLMAASIPWIAVGIALERGACFSVGGSCDEDDDTGGGGPIALGALLAVGGVMLLGVGAYRLDRWNTWKARQVTFTPAAGRTAHGTWNAGFTLRF